jgi:uncharacterized protein YggT (Ycf19 family)
MTAARTAPEAGDRTSGRITLIRVGRAIVYLVYALAITSVVILTIAFFLRLFAASTDAPFTEWVYRSADRIMQPFRGIFPPVKGSGESVLDVSVLFGMLMYGLLAMVVHSLIDWINRRLAMHTPPPATTAYPVQPPGGPPAR